MEFQNRGIAVFSIASAVCQQPSKEPFEALAETNPVLSPEETGSHWHEIARAWEAVKLCVEPLARKGDAAITSLAAEYTRLFRGLVPDRWARPAYEASHLACSRDEEILVIQQVQNLFTRAGISVNVHDRPDFIAVELDAMRELLARNSLGNGGALDSAQELFTEHLQKWVPAQAKEITAATHVPFYQTVSAYLDSIAVTDFPELIN